MHYTGVLALAGASLLLLDVVISTVRRRVSRLGIAAYLIILLDWALYVAAFVTQDYTLKPVYETSSAGLPLLFKVASSWSSGGGSLFLLTSVLAIVALVHRRYHRDPILAAGYGVLILSSLALAFLNGGFDSFHGSVATGMGLNPLLKSPWIYPHPLSTFTAYALIAASAVSLYSGHLKASELLARLGWLLLTLGIAIGGYWSYVTFGWGGYWAWDPVETAELTPWLALTAALHVRSLDRRLSYATQMTAAGSVFLAILVTRVGISPLHSFASPQSMTSALTLTLTFLFIVEGIRGSRTGGKSDLDVGGIARSPYRMGLALSYFSLFMMFLILFSVLAAGSAGSVLGLRIEVPQMDSGVNFFHPILLPFALLLVASLPMCTLGTKLGWREILGLIEGLSIISAVLLYLTYTRDIIWSPASSLITNMIISILLPFTLAGLFSGAAAFYIHARERLAVMSSVSLLHTAMALVMLGILLSGPFAYNRSYFKEATLPQGRDVDVGGLKLRLMNYEYGLYGGTVDLYTPYAGRSDIYRRASVTLLVLVTNLGEALKEVSGGERRLRESGVLGIYESLRGGVSVPGSFESRAVAVATTMTNNTRSTKELGEVRLSISDPVLVAFLGASQNETTLRLMAVGNVTLEGDLSGLRASPAVMMNLTFVHPLLIAAPNGTVEVRRASLVFFDMLRQGHSLPTSRDGVIVAPNSTIIVEDGVYHGKRDVKLPSRLEGRDVVLYVVFTQGRISSDIMDILKRHGLDRLLTNGTFVSKVIDEVLPGNCKQLIHASEEMDRCLGHLPVPRELPEGARLALRVDAGGTVRTMEVRFDANGEAQGIHGLVAQVLPVPSGLGDLYLVFNPPVVKDRSWSVGFHELMIYYLHESFRGLGEDQKLALASLFASAYLGGSVQEEMMLPYALDLYDLASRFDPANSTLRTSGAFVQVKVIPYISLLWWGVILMALSELSIMLLGLRGWSSRPDRSYQQGEGELEGQPEEYGDGEAGQGPPVPVEG